MRVLLDTHVLLWWLGDDAALRSEHRRLMADSRNTILVSAVSVAIKSSSGKLVVPEDTSGAIEESGLDELPLTAVHAEELRHLPWHHRDPFDRMLISQARVERIPILTADAAFARYDVELR